MEENKVVWEDPAFEGRQPEPLTVKRTINGVEKDCVERVPGNISFVIKTAARLKMTTQWSALKHAALSMLLAVAGAYPLMKLLVNEAALHDGMYMEIL